MWLDNDHGVKLIHQEAITIINICSHNISDTYVIYVSYKGIADISEGRTRQQYNNSKGYLLSAMDSLSRKKINKKLWTWTIQILDQMDLTDIL